MHFVLHVHTLKLAEIFPFCTPFVSGFSVSHFNSRGMTTFNVENHVPAELQEIQALLQ